MAISKSLVEAITVSWNLCAEFFLVFFFKRILEEGAQVTNTKYLEADVIVGRTIDPKNLSVFFLLQCSQKTKLMSFP